MTKFDKILNKLLDQTAKKKITWFYFSVFQYPNSFPFSDDNDLVSEESYFYPFENGNFTLSTFTSDKSDKKAETKLIQRNEKDNSYKFQIISKEQSKLFELKYLIERKRDVSDALDSFLNN